MRPFATLAGLSFLIRYLPRTPFPNHAGDFRPGVSEQGILDGDFIFLLNVSLHLFTGQG